MPKRRKRSPSKRGGAWYHDLLNWFTDDPEARRQAEANKRYGESLKDPNWLHKQLVKQKSAYDKQQGGGGVHVGPKGGRYRIVRGRKIYVS